MAAVQNDGWALKYIKEQTYELCLVAAKQDRFSLNYVKDLKIKEKIRLELNL
jgi:hypothetical protein